MLGSFYGRTITYTVTPHDSGSSPRTATFPYSVLEVSAVPVPAEDERTTIETELQFEIRGELVADTRTELEQAIRDIEQVTAYPRGTFKVLEQAYSGTPPSPAAPAAGGITKESRTLWWIIPAQSSVASLEQGQKMASDHGPFPSMIRFSRFRGGLASFYTWTLRVRVHECLTVAGATVPKLPTGKVLALTVSQRHSVDMNEMTTRAMRVTLIVSADAVPVDNKGRQTVIDHVPGVPPQYKREQQDWEQHANARILTCTIVDREVRTPLPIPITGGTVNFGVSSSYTGGMVTGTLSGWISAKPDRSRWEMLSIIVQIYKRKFELIQPDGKEFLTEANITETDIYNQNRLDFSFSAWGTGAVEPTFKKTLDFLSVVYTPILHTQPDFTDGKSEFIKPYGGEGVRGSSAGDPGVVDPCEAKTPNVVGGTGVGSSQGILASLGSSQNLSYGNIRTGLYGGQVNASPAARGGGAGGGGGGGAGGGSLALIPAEAVAREHRNAMWKELHEKVTFCLDNKVAVFSPQDVNADLIIQQTGKPTLIVTQVGYAKRWSTDAKRIESSLVQPPLFDEATAVLASASVTPEVPAPVGLGDFNEYAASWQYVMVIKDVGSNAMNNYLRFPPDPRRAKPEQASLKTKVLPLGF